MTANRTRAAQAMKCLRLARVAYRRALADRGTSFSCLSRAAAYVYSAAEAARSAYLLCGHALADGFSWDVHLRMEKRERAALAASKVLQNTPYAERYAGYTQLAADRAAGPVSSRF